VGYLLVVIETVLELEALVFLIHDFGLGPFARILIPLGAHLLAMVVLSFGFLGRWDYSRGEDRAWIAIGLSMSLPLPFIGFLGFVVLYAMFLSRPRGSGDLLKDFEEYISYDSSMLAEAQRKQNSGRFVMDEVDVEPLRDILGGDDIDLKRGAILSLSRLPRREAVILLKAALADPSREIRYYAGNALSDMEKEFNDRIFRLVREVERTPTHIEHHIDLAKFVLDYVDTGLLDESMVRYFCDIGLRALDKASMVGSDDPRILLLSGLLQRSVKNLAEAEESLLKYVEARRDDAETRLILAEIKFERGELESAKSVVEDGLQLFPEDPRFEDLKTVLGG